MLKRQANYMQFFLILIKAALTLNIDSTIDYLTLTS